MPSNISHCQAPHGMSCDLPGVEGPGCSLGSQIALEGEGNNERSLVLPATFEPEILCANSSRPSPRGAWSTLRKARASSGDQAALRLGHTGHGLLMAQLCSPVHPNKCPCHVVTPETVARAQMNEVGSGKIYGPALGKHRSAGR